MSEQWWEFARQMLREGGYDLSADGVLGPIRGHVGEVDRARIKNFNERAPFRAVRDQQLWNWVASLVDVTDSIAKAAEQRGTRDIKLLAPMLWLRLHGVLVEIDESLSLLRSLMEEKLATGTDPLPGSILADTRPLLHALDQLRKSLSEDELLWAEYRRHVEAHVWQEAYEPQWNKKRDAPRELHRSKFTRQGYTPEDLNRRLQAVLRTFGTETALTITFAAKLHRSAEILLATVRVWTGR
jgi:hypothetical protein